MHLGRCALENSPIICVNVPFCDTSKGPEFSNFRCFRFLIISGLSSKPLCFFMPKMATKILSKGVENRNIESFNSLVLL